MKITFTITNIEENNVEFDSYIPGKLSTKTLELIAKTFYRDVQNRIEKNPSADTVDKLID